MDQLDAVPEYYHDWIRLIGMEATEKLCAAYGGRCLYIPKMEVVKVRERQSKIRSEFNGHNTAALAARYGLSLRAVQRIVKEGYPKGGKP